MSVKDKDTINLNDEDFEAHWDAKFDAISRVYSLRPGHTLTQEDFDAIQKLDADYRENEESALEGFHRGYRQGLKEGGSADIAEMSARLDEKVCQLGVAKAVGQFRYQWGFREGAQACREMMARFVEQGGDAITAGSIRANWHPGWGDDPGAPKSVAGTAELADEETPS